MTCWNCEAHMKRIAVDAFYFYYQCQSCGKERMELREDRAKPGPEYDHLFEV